MDRSDCPMRHYNGNCKPHGGFCTAVSNSVCESIRNAYDDGWMAAAENIQTARDRLDSAKYRARDIQLARAQAEIEKINACYEAYVDGLDAMSKTIENLIRVTEQQGGCAHDA